MPTRTSPPRARTAGTLLLLCVTVGEASALAQAGSLGAVARREEERRKQIASGRIYTNAELANVDPPPPDVQKRASSEPRPAETAADSETASAEKPSEPSAETKVARQKQDEKYWRSYLAGLREAVSKANADLAAQEARLREIEDDSSPTAVREREVINRTITRMRAAARVHTEVLARNLTQAELSGVSRDWLR